MPFVLHHLENSESSFWILLIAITGVSQLLTTGYQPTLIRNIAMLNSSTIDMEVIRTSEELEAKKSDYLLSEILTYAKLRYSIIGKRLFFIYMSIGSIFMSIISPENDRSYFLIVWAIFALAQSIQYFFGYYEIFLRGMDQAINYSKFLIISRFILIMLSLISLQLNYGLIGLAICMLIASILSRIFAKNFASCIDVNPTEIILTRIQLKQKYDEAFTRFSYHIFVAQLGVFIQSRGMIIIATMSIGLIDSSSYALTMSILTSLYGISTESPKYLLPKLINSNLQRNHFESKAIYQSLKVQSLAIYSSGCLVVFLLCREFLAYIGSSVEILSGWRLLVLMFLGILEVNLNCSHTLISTFNRRDYATSSTITSGCIVVLVLILVPIMSLNTFIFIPLILQGFFNFWFWPIKAQKMLRFD